MEYEKKNCFELPPPQGFTLAEVLITLGIIGVVAALTIPTLIQNHKKTVIETRLKKAYSVINQAVNLSISNDTWIDPPLDKRYDDKVLNEWLQTSLFPYLNNVKLFSPNQINHPLNTISSRYGVILSDGTTITFHNNVQIHTYIDINGTKGPNRYGSDVFTFFLDYKNSRGRGYFYPSGYAWSQNGVDDGPYTDNYVYGDRDGMVKYCKKEYSSSQTTCALLIMHDGWKIPDDYPAKI